MPFTLTENQRKFLRPWFEHMETKTGSVLILAIEDERPNTVKIGWLNAKERAAVRKALDKVNEQRVKVGERRTDEIPT